MSVRPIIIFPPLIIAESAIINRSRPVYMNPYDTHSFLGYTTSRPRLCNITPHTLYPQNTTVITLIISITHTRLNHLQRYNFSSVNVALNITNTSILGYSSCVTLITLHTQLYLTHHLTLQFHIIQLESRSITLTNINNHIIHNFLILY